MLAILLAAAIRENPLSYQMINSNDALQSLCLAATAHNTLALDTEFVRIRSYYPKLGLIQLAYADKVALIDPLAINDWSGFIGLLRDQRITKFLHAGSEDLEIFQHYFGTLPEPFIDTQVLAAFTGYSLSVGLANLLEQTIGVRLDKSETRTDWLARPLSRRQCDYASADVAYLLLVAQQLLTKAQQAGWLLAAQQECQQMLIQRGNPQKPENAWRDIGKHAQLSPRQLACLQLLAAWRLHTAQQRDLALNFVLQADKLWQVARYLPTSLHELVRLELHDNEIRRHGHTLLAKVAQVKALAAENLPTAVIQPQRVDGFQSLMTEIKTTCQKIAEQAAIPATLLASRRQIEQLIKWHWQICCDDISVIKTPELMTGWRSDWLAVPLSTLLERYPRPANLEKKAEMYQ